MSCDMEKSLFGRDVMCDEVEARKAKRKQKKSFEVRVVSD